MSNAISASEKTMTKAIVCSFYTNDDYYRAHANRLRKNLESLGVEIDLREIIKNPGEDWASICRKKVGFIAEVCAANPDKKVFWIDVDCELYSIPDFILNSTADIVGFQRGFSNPLKIGYENRGRFWEPCFWGINTTQQARNMIAAAAEFERIATVRATDDFFFEEAWRAASPNLTFQIIPSNCAVDKGKPSIAGHQVFFRFGSSGQVANFKDKVEQHKGAKAKKQFNPKLELLRLAKEIEDILPVSLSTKLRQVVDASGITGILTGTKHNVYNNKVMVNILRSGRSGDVQKYNENLEIFKSKTLPDNYETALIKVSSTFLAYSGRKSDQKIMLALWENPFPGNYGDWLTPFIFSYFTNNKIIFQGLTSRAHQKHIVSLGSVGRFIKSNSVVVGTGVSSFNHALQAKADYVSVRGPHTAELLKRSGGPTVASFGDPAVLLSKIVPVKREQTNSRTAFIRHHTHLQAPVILPSDFDEISVLLSHPDDVIAFITKLNEYDKVVTSAMHVMITCQSYGIPCALVSFIGFEEYVHGDGTKYSDYALGAGVEIMDPVAIDPNLNMAEITPLVKRIQISNEKMEEVEAAILEGLRRVKG